jgi:predicted lipoprotein with Yx(FWY)xxD motif
MKTTQAARESSLLSALGVRFTGATAILVVLATAMIGAACGDQRGKLVPPTALAGKAGESSTGGGGAGGTGRELAGDGGVAGENALGPAGGAGADSGPAAGGAPSGDSGAGGEPDAPPPAAGAGGEGGVPDSAQAGAGGEHAGSDESCVYRTDVEGTSSAGGGAGGEAALVTIAKGTNRLIGDYLTDGAGLALYVFGADFAGDCRSPPISDCAADCLASWPVFHSEKRVLAAGLDAEAFGSIRRADGAAQTTYFGWPLYRYANDTKAGDVTGHGSGVWGLAQVVPPNVIVRRAGTDRFLADGRGRTLYAFEEDTLGAASSSPASACAEGCRDAHPPFSPAYVGAISTLKPQDFAMFIRGDGELQAAYRGAPLYFSDLDRRPGDTLGAGEPGWSLVLRQ